jgi:serine protease
MSQLQSSKEKFNMGKGLVSIGMILLILGFVAGPQVGAAVWQKDPTLAITGGRPHLPDSVLVKLRAPTDSLEVKEFVAAYGCKITRNISSLSILELKIPDAASVGEMVQLLEEDPLVEYAEPNYIYELEAFEPNDWFWVDGHLWNLAAMRMPEAWEWDTTPPLYGGDPQVVCAIIDTGVCYRDAVADEYDPPVDFYQAPDLSGTNFWVNEDEVPDNLTDDDGNGYVDDVNGYDFAYDDPLPLDDNSHGTHIAGTIAQSTNNDPGGGVNDYSAVGIAFNTTIMPLKTMQRGATGSSLGAIVEALTYAADNGANVVNMSFGAACNGTSNSSGDKSEREACQYAYDRGVVLVAATGNDADPAHPEPGCPNWSCSGVGPGYPAGFPFVIGVGASESAYDPGDPYSEQRAAYSNYGYGVDVVAPAGDYYTGDKDNSGYDDLTFQQVPRLRNFTDGYVHDFKIAGYVGTSMATPHVVGLAALILADGLAHGVNLTPKEVRNRILASAVDINRDTAPGYDLQCGFGRIDAFGALTINPIPEFRAKGADFNEVSGDGDGRPEAGETVDAMAYLMPMLADATNIQATLSASDPYVTIIEPTAQFPDGESNEYTINQTQPFRFEIAEDCPPQHVVQFTLNVTCSQSAPQQVTWTVVINPPNILLVDDDRNYAWSDGTTHDNLSYYSEALDLAGIPYDVHQVKLKPHCFGVEAFPFEPNPFERNLPSLNKLMRYDAVLWFMPRASDGGPTKKELNNDYLPLWTAYLDAGRGLFLSSDEFLYKLHSPPQGTDDDVVEIAEDSFTYNYFHIARVEHDEWYYEIRGIAGDPISDGLGALPLDDFISENPAGPNCQGEYSWWPDNIEAREDAAAVFTSGPIAIPPGSACSEDTEDTIEEGPCAVRYPADAGSPAPFRTVFMAFPLETVELEPRAQILERIVSFLTDFTQATPTPNPTPTTYPPTATPPCAQMGVEVLIPDDYVSPGETFYCHAQICNTGRRKNLQPFVAMLDIGINEYWFYPSWSHYPPDFDYAILERLEGASYTLVQVIPEFTWPDTGNSSYSNITIFSALLTKDLTSVLGEIGSATFGYGPP